MRAAASFIPAIKELARQNRTLFEKIGEAIDSFLEKLRAAFGEARAA